VRLKSAEPRINRIHPRKFFSAKFKLGSEAEHTALHSQILLGYFMCFLK
jgi:hypothetical protein